MSCLGIHDDLRCGRCGRCTGRGQRRTHRLDAVERDAAVLAGVEPEHRRAQRGRDIDGVRRLQHRGLSDEPAIPGDARSHLRAVRGVQPSDASAPTESRDADLALDAARPRTRPLQRRVEVRHDLRVRHLGDDIAHQRLDIGHLRRIALASEKFRRDGDRAALRETTADIADVLVHAEDLLHHQHHRQLRAARRPRVVRRQRAIRDRYADLAGIQSL